MAQSRSITTDTRLDPTTRWQRCSHACIKDLIIKKFVISIIALLNLAALGTSFYYIIAYTSIPTQVVLVSPFIIGVLGALTYLKFPTCGISSGNYRWYVDPLALIGRALAYLFFGPLMYVSNNRIDLTPYHDPFKADDISNDLRKLPFDQLAETYGKHFSNLYIYGFVNRKTNLELKSLYKRYKPLKRSITFYQEGTPSTHMGCLREKALAREKAKVNKLVQEWQQFKKTNHIHFPHPKVHALDFSKFSTRVELKARSYCCFGTPFDVFSDLQA